MTCAPLTKEYSFCMVGDAGLDCPEPILLLLGGKVGAMPRITEERREARREQILEAARSCLQEHGLEAVSMEMIIARSGLSTGAVYGYFKGKDEIIKPGVP